jgi:site-specific recombinase XerD
MAIDQYLTFISEERKIRYEDISFKDWKAENINNFLISLENVRHVSASTRNQRLFALRSFLKFSRISSPELVALSLEASDIKMAKERTEPVAFLSEKGIEILLKTPDDKTRTGLRDMCFMITMYDTAARDCEMLNLKVSSLDLNDACPKIRLDGKGNKVRYVPLMKKTVIHLKRYLEVFHQEDEKDDKWLFYTVSHGRKNKMSDDNVARFLAKYSAIAHEQLPEIPAKVTPHQLRHSRAMHLYRHGMPLQLLAEYMGHASVISTQIYAYADTEMKRAALEKCQLHESNDTVPAWKNDEALIKKLYGLV